MFVPSRRLYTRSLLENYFSRSVANSHQRRQCRKKYRVPEADCTSCPKLDKTVRAQLPKSTKDQDRGLARLQTFVTDCVGPLAHILEEAQKGSLSTKNVVNATRQAIKFLRNASSHIAQERRRKIAGYLNSDVRVLVEDEDQFVDAAPMLFGKNFDKAVKEYVDAVKSLRKSYGNGRHQSTGSQFFRGGRPHQGRGGGRIGTKATKEEGDFTPSKEEEISNSRRDTAPRRSLN